MPDFFYDKKKYQNYLWKKNCMNYDIFEHYLI